MFCGLFQFYHGKIEKSSKQNQNKYLLFSLTNDKKNKKRKVSLTKELVYGYFCITLFEYTNISEDIHGNNNV